MLKTIFVVAFLLIHSLNVCFVCASLPSTAWAVAVVESHKKPTLLNDLELKITELRYKLNMITVEARNCISKLDQFSLVPIGTSESENSSPVKLLILQSSMLDVQNKVLQLEEELSENSGNLSVIMGHIGRLDDGFRSLKMLVDDEKRQIFQSIKRHEELNTLLALYKSLEDFIQNLQWEFQEKKQLVQFKHKCIKAIKSRNYLETEDYCLGNYTKLEYLIKEVYNDQINNFYLVLKFGDSVANLDRRCQFHKHYTQEFFVRTSFRQLFSRYM